MNISKGNAFLICVILVMIIFLCLYVLVIAKDEDIKLIPVGMCLSAVVGATTAYMGIQMANNGIKGRNWNQDMFDSENKTEEKK